MAAEQAGGAGRHSTAQHLESHQNCKFECADRNLFPSKSGTGEKFTPLWKSSFFRNISQEETVMLLD